MRQITIRGRWLQRLHLFDQQRTAVWLGVLIFAYGIPFVAPWWTVYQAVPNTGSGPGVWIGESAYGLIATCIGLAQIIGSLRWPAHPTRRVFTPAMATIFWWYTSLTLFGVSNGASPGGWMSVGMALACSYSVIRGYWRL